MKFFFFPEIEPGLQTLSHSPDLPNMPRRHKNNFELKVIKKQMQVKFFALPLFA